MTQAERFAQLVSEESGVEMTPENVLKCIEYARQAMMLGLCTVEAYYQAKNLLLEQVKCVNEWTH